MPNDLLKEFAYMYEWAMIDSMPFTVDHFRQVNKLINRIIDALCSIKQTHHDRIIKYRLDLDDSGDCDLQKQMQTNTNSLFTDVLLNSEYCSLKSTSKQVKFDEAKNNDDSLNERTSSKLKQTSKNLFARKQPKEKSSEFSTNNFDKEKLLNDDSLNDTSFESTRSKTPHTRHDLNESNETSHYSTINAESIKPFDSAHEQIPLVSTSSKKSTSHSKKKSNQSDVTLIPTVVTATSTGFVTSSAATSKSAAKKKNPSSITIEQSNVKKSSSQNEAFVNTQ